MSTFRVAPLLAACLALAGCGGGSIDNEAAIRVIQASPDLPLVNVLIDGVAVRSAIDYRGGTGLIFVTPRNYDFTFQAILPGDDAVVIDKPGTPILAGREYTLLAIGKAETPVPLPGSLQGLLIDNPVADTTSGNTRLQVLHAAPDEGQLDVYLTARDSLGNYADLLGETPSAQVTYGENPADRFEKPSGTYLIRITHAGTKTPVLFNSGELAFRSRADFLLVAVTNTATGGAPISLVINDRTANLPVLDKDSPSDLRVVHVSPDAPALDVKGVGTSVVPTVCVPQVSPCPAVAPPPVTFASGLAYLGFTSYVSAPPDTYNVSGVLTSDPNPTTAPFTFSRFLGIGQRATAFAAGLLATIDDLVIADNFRPVFTEGQIRIVDAAPASGTVDVYIKATGTDITLETATLFNLVLRSVTTYIPFTPGTYTVTFAESGTKTVLASVEVPATAGRGFTAVLVDEVRVDASSDGKPPSVLLIDDQAP